jgi:hypothetical protein
MSGSGLKLAALGAAMQEHQSCNSQRKRTLVKYESPEEEITAAGAYRELREKLGAAFLETQQEAYESWCAMDQDSEAQNEEPM